jgi:2Fe-2S ferredoxin
MPFVTFIDARQEVVRVKAEPGVTAMEAARRSGVRGIVAQCGGECLCSTCHCYVADDWFEKLPAKKEDEASLLDFAWRPRPTSRLACQIMLTDALDGLVLYVPERQL